jgi:hypothetical protein
MKDCVIKKVIEKRVTGCRDTILLQLLQCRSVVVKAPCYKPEGRGLETRGGERFLSIYLILPAALGPGLYSVSNRNEYQKHKNNVSGE